LAYAALLALAALDAAGYSVIAPVVPAIEADTGAGTATLGLLVAVFGLGQLVGFPLAGRALARTHARAVVGASLAVVAAGDVAFVVADSLGVWFGARFLQGVGAGGLWMGVTFAALERWPGEEYRRLSGVLAAYSVGGVAGYALGGVEGVRGPFSVHLALVVAGIAAIAALGRVHSRPGFGSDRGALRTRGFALASAGILLVAIAYGVLDGPLPLHFAERLSQRGIALLLVAASVVVGVAAAAAGRLAPRSALALGVSAIPVGIGLAGAGGGVGVWLVALALVAAGFGFGETGALGVLLDEVGHERIVLAMVVWSQVWGVGYLAGPAVAGGVADALGFGALVLVPVAAALPVAALLAPLASRGDRAARPARG
jgi:MFS family permease